MAKYDEDPFDYDDDEDDGFMTFDAREEENDSNRGPFILAGLVLLLVAFGAIVSLFLMGDKNSKNETPQITAAAEPFKEIPIEGDPLLNEPTTDGLDGASNPPPLSVEAMGNVEDPLLGENVVSSPVTKPANTTVNTPPKPVVANTQPVAAPKPVVKPTVTPTKTVEKVAPKVTASVTNSVPKPSTTKPATTTTANKASESPKASTSSSASSGSYSAQLGSFQSKDAAETALSNYRATGLSGPVTIVKADLGAKGVWYRIKATGFENRDQVVGFCTKAKSAGANCIPSK